MATVLVQIEDTLAPGNEQETIDDPVQGAREFLLGLHEAGHKVLIASSRITPNPRSSRLVLNWLASHDLYYDDVHVVEGIPQDAVIVSGKCYRVSSLTESFSKRLIRSLGE